MVDVSAKNATRREAEASAFVELKPVVLKALPSNPKGDPLEVRTPLTHVLVAGRDVGLDTKQLALYERYSKRP